MKTNLIKHPLLMALVAAVTAITARAQLSTNLLQNANGQTGNLSGWTAVASGGNGWHVGTDYGGAMTGSSNAFMTSYGWDVRSQTIDLLADGFTTAQLDSAPTISISDWVHGYFATGDYFMNVQLENASHNVIASWSQGSQSSPLTIAPSAGWTDGTGSLQNYGSGVRYIVFEDGGKDTLGWLGYYGAAFDASSVTLMIQPVPEPTALALAGLGALSLLLFRRRNNPIHYN